VDRALTQAQFSPARIDDKLVRKVLARTEVIADPALDALYPEKFPARVTIRMDDGTAFQETVMLPKGDPGNPLSPDEIAEKFRANCAGVLKPVQTEQLLTAIRALPEAANTDTLRYAFGPL